MRILIAILGFVASTAFAADEIKCAPYMPCGDYQGTGAWYDVNGKIQKDEDGNDHFNERIIISPVDPSTVNIKVYIYMGKTPKKPWTDSNIIFEKNGQLTLVDGGGVSHAAGFCAHEVCTVSFAPLASEYKGEKFINAFTNILRFDNGNLKRYNMVADYNDDSKLMFQRSDLKKQ